MVQHHRKLFCPTSIFNRPLKLKNMIEFLTLPQSGPKTEILRNIEAQHRTPAARHQALKQCYDAAMRQALTNDVAAGHRNDVYGANTYSGTLVTSFLEEGSLTDLVNEWAYLDAFSIAKDVDPFKPLASGVFKHTTGGEATLTNPTNWEQSDGSTVAAITLNTTWLSQPMRVGAQDLNNGLRIEDLRQKAIATFADSLTVLATAPITAANFTATPIISAPATFGFNESAILQGQLQKSSKKNLILDGTYLARLTNNPGYFQKTGSGLDDPGAYKPYGWNGIYLASNWTGAGNNIKGFACNPQAIVRATGLPASMPAPNYSVKQFELPGLNVAVAMSQWFSLASRTMFVTFDIIAAFAAGDKTAGVVVAGGTPS
jgi:hypothetical protein